MFLEVLSPSALYGAGNQKAPHPLEEMSVDKILYYLEKFKAKYPNFDELNIEFTMGPAEFGGMNWWELRGIRTV